MSDGEAGRMTDPTPRSGPLEGCLRGSPRAANRKQMYFVRCVNCAGESPMLLARLGR